MGGARKAVIDRPKNWVLRKKHTKKQQGRPEKNAVFEETVEGMPAAHNRRQGPGLAVSGPHLTVTWTAPHRGEERVTKSGHYWGSVGTDQGSLDSSENEKNRVPYGRNEAGERRNAD